MRHSDFACYPVQSLYNFFLSATLLTSIQSQHRLRQTLLDVLIQVYLSAKHRALLFCPVDVLALTGSFFIQWKDAVLHVIGRQFHWIGDIFLVHFLSKFASNFGNCRCCGWSY